MDSEYMQILSYILLSIGAIFILFGVWGVIKLKNMPYIAHASGIIDSAGLLFISLGTATYQENFADSLKILFIMFLMWITSSTSTHILIFMHRNNNTGEDNE